MSALAFNPLIEGGGYNPPAPPPAAVAGSASAQVGGYGLTASSDVQGMRPLTGLHNIPLRVGVMGLLALVTLWLLRLGGFRFSVAGDLRGITR